MPESQPTTKAEQLLGAEILQNSSRHFENIFLAQNPLAAKRLPSGDGFVFLDGLVRLLFQPTGGAGRASHARLHHEPSRCPGPAGGPCPARGATERQAVAHSGGSGFGLWSQTGRVHIPALPLPGTAVTLGLAFPVCKMGCI